MSDICKIADKRSQKGMDAFHSNWICRYSRTIQVTFENVSEFKSVFKEMCYTLGIKCRPTTSYNPGGNSIIDRIHQVMGNLLRSFELEERELDPEDPSNEFLQACAFGIRSIFSYNSTSFPKSINIWKRYYSLCQVSSKLG
jgi:hypothetical protein